MAPAAEKDEGWGVKLDIGGGESRNRLAITTKGSIIDKPWVTLDINPRADFVHDLNNFPYPLRDNSISEMRMHHTLEHVEVPPIKVMQELYRIAKHGCILEIKVPWYKFDWFSCPHHLHWFAPNWFHGLTPHITRKGLAWHHGNDYIQNGMDWRVVKQKTLRGSKRFWKKYELTVWLEAHK